MCVCARLPWVLLLGHSLGLVPLLALDEDVDGLLDQVHVQVELGGLSDNRETV